ncbi:response regulator transcription factor [Frankia sp. AgB32]|uniref:response regulator transcription factor n=1 Tax=Frankia sp. AgB32 TaxID=631119 RepID=UPI00200E073E|nr:response regulator transcription factor [Frankia sp. AgB32]MCK9895740.1 response regulator transcription factor [Frankia sp. AgB32]
MKVIIVEDERLYLDALAETLHSRSIEVAGRASTFDDALRVVNESACDVALLDVRLSKQEADGGLRIAAELRRLYPDVGLLVLSGFDEVAYVERLMNLEGGQGSVGYLLKERVGDVDELAGALARVAAGEVVIDPYLIRRLMARPRRRDPLDALSPYETRVLSLVAEGRSNLRIAQELDIKISTVEKHLSAITSKLGLRPTDGLERRSVNVRVLAAMKFLRRGSAGPGAPQNPPH